MKKKPVFLLVLLLLGLAAPLRANTSMDIGEGAELCQKYAKRPLGKKNNYIVWVQGFFSAFNALDPKTKSIAGNRDYHYVRKWLDDYCKANPTMYFGEAVRMLIEELYPTRIPNTPEQESKSGAGIGLHFK